MKLMRTKDEKRLPTQGLDDVGLAHLPGPGDEQGFFSWDWKKRRSSATMFRTIMVSSPF